MSSRVLALALLQVGAVVLIGRTVVAAIARHLDRDREWLGLPERWLLSLMVFVAFATVLMLAHIATRGWLFATAWVVPSIGAALVAAIARRRRSFRPSWRVPVVVLILALVLVAVYALPAIRGGSGLRTGDPPWHLGWTEQILGGDARPSGPAPEPFARNAYPWGYHAVLATMVRLVPGSDPLIAHEALHLLLIAAIPLAAACLARVMNRRAGIAAAAMAALVGGFGWLASGGPDFVPSPREARYGADLVVASPNSVYELLPPALPRELGLVLLGAVGVLLAAFVRRPSRVTAFASGAAMGLVGLVSVPMFVSAAVWGGALMLISARTVPAKQMALTTATALVVLGMWALPVAIDYMRFDGFTDVSPRLGVEWALSDGIAAWGLLFPLALGGLAIAIGQPPIVRRPLLVFGGCAALLLGLSWLRARTGWDVFANATLLHQGRYWPALHLVAAALAGIGLTVGYGWLRARSRSLAAATAALILGVGAISPVYASVDLTRTIREGKDGFLYGKPDYQEGSFLRTAAENMDPDDVMLVVDDDLFAFYLWQFSGARIADDNAGSPDPNPWRIRYRVLAREWYATEREEGFDFDWVFSKRVQFAGVDTRAIGTFRNERWQYFSSHD